MLTAWSRSLALARRGPRPAFRTLPLDSSWTDTLQQVRSIEGAVAEPDWEWDWSRVASRRSVLYKQAAPQSRVMETVRLLGATRAVDGDLGSRRWSSRIAPAAGGLHTVRPLAWCENDDTTGLWFTDGATVFVPSQLGQQLIAAVHAAVATPERISAAIFAVASPANLLKRYGSGLGVPLIWRDAGAFLATAQLVAAAAGLSGRIAGIAQPLSGRIYRGGQPAVVGALALSGTPGAEA